MKSEDDEKNVDEVTACPDCKGTHLKRDYDHAEILAKELAKNCNKGWRNAKCCTEKVMNHV